MFKDLKSNDQYKKATKNAEISRLKMGIVAFCLVGAAPTFYYVFFSQAIYPLYVNILLILGAITLCINAIALKFHQNYRFAATLCALGITPPLLALVTSGGYQNTALYWVFPYVLAIFMFLGHRLGLIINLSVFALIATLIFTPELIDAEYTYSDTTRFIASYSVSIFLSFLTEFLKLVSFNELAILSEDKHKLANTDPLTKLPNRRYVDSEYLKNIALAPAHYIPMSLVLIDIDYFKKVNDSYGHSVGDEVLKHVAACFEKSIRESDLICRTGGEEFVLLLPSTSIDDAARITEKVRGNVANSPYEYKNGEITVTISAGISKLTSVESFNQALANADALLYKAKHNGRNQIQIEKSE